MKCLLKAGDVDSNRGGVQQKTPRTKHGPKRGTLKYY